MPEDFGSHTKSPGSDGKTRAPNRASYRPAVAGCCFVVVAGGLLLRSLSTGVPITEPWSLVATAALAVVGVALLIGALRHRGESGPVKARVIVGVAAVVVVAGLFAASSSKLLLRWHVGNARPELDAVADRLLKDAPQIQSEASETGWATRPVVTGVPRQAGGFDVKDVAVTSDSSHTWLDITVGVNSWGVMSSECRGLTYAPAQAPDTPTGFARLGTSAFHPIAIGRYEHLEGDWYWHEWTCFSI